MSPRRNHPKGKGPKEPDRDISHSFETVEEHLEGIYTVRKVTGSSTTKPYRCPGCDQLIPTATPHIVAWVDDDLDNRRHWHSSCWQKKDQRKPKTLRSRNAPKY